MTREVLGKMSKGELVTLLLAGIIGRDGHYRHSLMTRKELMKWRRHELASEVVGML